MYLRSNKVIGEIIWVEEPVFGKPGRIFQKGKVRVQFGDRKHWRVTVPMSMIEGREEGELKKGDQLRVYLDENREPERAEVLKRPHTCRNFRLVSHNFREATLRCTSCMKSKVRTITSEEKRTIYGGDVDEGFLSVGKLHDVWKNFKDNFLDHEGQFLLRGYALMDAIKLWAKKYPEDVRTVSVDDSHFMSSSLYFIEHRTENEYMGTTVVYAGQCGDAAHFFMYPGHLNSVMTVLGEIKKEALLIQKREKKLAQERSRRLHKLFKKG